MDVKWIKNEISLISDLIGSTTEMPSVVTQKNTVSIDVFESTAMAHSAPYVQVRRYSIVPLTAIKLGVQVAHSKLRYSSHSYWNSLGNAGKSSFGQNNKMSNRFGREELLTTLHYCHSWGTSVELGLLSSRKTAFVKRVTGWILQLDIYFLI